VRNAPFLAESEQFYKDKFALYPAGLDTWGGFIFLYLAPAEPSATQLGPVAGRIERYPLADLL
jgi:Rieske 2Fe-2S family protein